MKYLLYDVMGFVHSFVGTIKEALTWARENELRIVRVEEVPDKKEEA